MRIRRFIGFIVVIQSILFLEHFLLYKTWTFSVAEHAAGGLWIKLILGLLSVSFVAASLLAWRYTNPALRAFYRVAAVWLAGAVWLAAAGAVGLAGSPDVDWLSWVDWATALSDSRLNAARAATGRFQRFIVRHSSRYTIPLFVWLC